MRALWCDYRTTNWSEVIEILTFYRRLINYLNKIGFVLPVALNYFL